MGPLNEVSLDCGVRSSCPSLALPGAAVVSTRTPDIRGTWAGVGD